MSILALASRSSTGQAEVANILSKLMNSPSWMDSVFFLTYDEGGGPYDHVPPVPGQSNDKTNLANMGYLPLDRYSGHQHHCRQSGCQPPLLAMPGQWPG